MKIETRREKFTKLKENPLLLELHDSPDKEAILELLKNEYVARKCDRQRRVPEHLSYIEVLGSELINNQLPNQKVIDIGPGPGEFLEICRYLDYEVKGYDALLDDSEMGDEYVLYSSLMAKQQQIDIEYVGFENLISALPFVDDSVFFINSRGSIEQVFKQHLKGIPHRIEIRAERSWVITDSLREEFLTFLKEAERVLQNRGVILIRGNGNANTKEYDLLLKRAIAQVPNLYLDERFSFENRLHKIIKIKQ